MLTGADLTLSRILLTPESEKNLTSKILCFFLTPYIGM